MIVHMYNGTVVVLCEYKGGPRKYPEKCWTLTALILNIDSITGYP